MVNTYACKNAIINSKNIIAVTTTQGNTAIKVYIEPALNNPQEKPIKIFNKA
jgi:hypothetical protein